MLQQTQVDSVIDAFKRWMKDYPNLKALSQASEEEVLDHWAGLGYYRRARNLLAAAKGLVARGWVNLPDRREDLLELPGVGGYTVGAILSLAFGRKEPILDGNVVRVLSRFHAIHFLPITRDQKAWYWNQAREWANGANPGETNEALMELGAMVCTVKSPQCRNCPLKTGCQGLKLGEVDRLPPAKTREQTMNLSGEAWVVRKAGHYLLVKPEDGSLLAGHWNFPIAWMAPLTEGAKSSLMRKEDRSSQLQGEKKTWTALRLATQPGLKKAGSIRHAITKYRIQVEIVERSWKGVLAVDANWTWVSKDGVANFLVTSLARKIWKAYLSQS